MKPLVKKEEDKTNRGTDTKKKIASIAFDGQA